MPSTRCKKGTRRCLDERCHKKKKMHHFSKKKLGKCRKGSRRCGDLKCYKRKVPRIMSRSTSR